MAVKTAVIEVTEDPVQVSFLEEDTNSGSGFTLLNKDGLNSVWLGGDPDTDGLDWEVGAGEGWSERLGGYSDQVYAKAATGQTVSVQVIHTGV